MPTIIVTNPLRALQVENQRLRKEIEVLRQQLATSAARRELGSDTGNTIPLAQASMPVPVQPMRLDGAAASPAARSLPAASAPRPMVHVMAADSVMPSSSGASRLAAPAVSVSPWPVRAEPEALDDAATRFMLLELD